MSVEPKGSNTLNMKMLRFLQVDFLQKKAFPDFAFCAWCENGVNACVVFGERSVTDVPSELVSVVWASAGLRVSMYITTDSDKCAVCAQLFKVKVPSRRTQEDRKQRKAK